MRSRAPDCEKRTQPGMSDLPCGGTHPLRFRSAGPASTRPERTVRDCAGIGTQERTQAVPSMATLHHVRFKMKPMERFLAEEEMARLNAVLTRDGFWRPHIVAIIHLLMLTGCSARCRWTAPAPKRLRRSRSPLARSGRCGPAAGANRLPPGRSAQSPLAQHRKGRVQPGGLEDWPARRAARQGRTRLGTAGTGLRTGGGPRLKRKRFIWGTREYFTNGLPLEAWLHMRGRRGRRCGWYRS